MRRHKYQAWHKRERKMYEVTTLLMGFEGKDLVRVKGKSVHEELWVGDDVELREYIGHLDVHSKEIHEGDILLLGYGDGSWYTGAPVVVKYGLHYVGFDSDAASSGPALGFYFSPYPYDEGWNDEPVGVGENFSWKSPVEIIGNVWENSDLLKEQAK